MISVTFIRHGATKANFEHRYLGRTDEPLSKEGSRQLVEKSKTGRYGAVGLVFTSPMLRCRQTAEILFPKTEQYVIPQWREIDFGAFEGKTYQDLQGNTEYQAWLDSGGSLPFPGGESREAFIKRVLLGWERAADCLERKTEAAAGEYAAVVHGGTIMALCSRLLGGAYFDYQVSCGEGLRMKLALCRDGLELLGVQEL